MAAVTIEDLANTLHIDRRHLTNVFRKSYGISPHAFLMELRLNKAREFLRSGCSVTDAAAMAGFSDLPNFSKKYKSRFGLCPRDEKEQTRHT
jgi:transcriptional regulator GlxA family with amidase domain